MARPIYRQKNEDSTVTSSVALSPKAIQAFKMMEDTSPDAPLLIGWGGAKGGSKSFSARTLAILRRQVHPGTAACIFRKTYPDLRDTHILNMQKEWPELFAKFWSADAKAILYPDGGSISFVYADTFQDVLALRGREYGDLFIDEATDLDEASIKALFSTARSSVANFTPKIFLGFNPGGPGHGFVRRIFIDKELEPAEAEMHPAFIQAYAWDNHIWVQNALKRDHLSVQAYFSWDEETRKQYFLAHSDYVKMLLTQVDYLRDAWLWGKWDVFAGQFFTCWDPDRHVYLDKKVKIQPWWTKWISIDYGFRHPASAHWHAADFDGKTYTYREHVATGRTPTEFGADVAMLTRASGDFEQIDSVWLSPDAFGTKHSDRTYADEIGDELDVEGIPRPERADNDRKGGAALLFQMLKEETWAISDNCPLLIKCLPTLVHDEKGTGDVLKVDAVDGRGGDDTYDDVRYGLKSRQRFAKKPVDMLVAEKAKDAGLDYRKDLTSWNIQLRKLQAEIGGEQNEFVSLRGSGRERYGRELVQ